MIHELALFDWYDNIYTILKTATILSKRRYQVYVVIITTLYISECEHKMLKAVT